MKRTVVLLLAVLFLTVACGPLNTPVTPTRAPESSAIAPPRLSYQAGACDEKNIADLQDQVTFSTAANKILIEQQVRYVCCARIDMVLQQEGRLLKVVETNTGKVCKCICGYHLQAQIENLPPGSYQVQVWGIQFENSQEAKLLGEGLVTLPVSAKP
jgi:hypothetical protein